MKRLFVSMTLLALLPVGAQAQGSTSSATITVNSPAGSMRSGFYVCVGTSTNREQYGGAVTPTSGSVNFSNLPKNGRLLTTVMRKGYTGAEQEWRPEASQNAAIFVPIATGSGGPTCPGYQAPVAKSLQAASATTGLRGEVRMPVQPPPIVKVVDQYGDPFSGGTVAFAVTQGGGNVSTASVVSGANGIASITWNLGAVPGANTLAAAVQGQPASLTFSATGVRVPASLAATTATTQQVQLGNTAVLPQVVVRDRHGDPVSGASVSFTNSLGAAITPSLASTGADGIARTTGWRLTTVGTFSVTAGVPGFQIPTVKFSVQVIQTAIISPIAPDAPPPPPPPLLGEERLTERGSFSEITTTLDCRTEFGASYVMVGIGGRQDLGVYNLFLICAPVSSNGTLGALRYSRRFGESYGNIAGDKQCDTSGKREVVVGLEGKLVSNQVRFLRFICRGPMNASGLVTLNGTSPPLTIGKDEGEFWTSSIMCSGGRAAPGGRVAVDILKTAFNLTSPSGIVGVQLICQQPTVS